MMHAHDRCEFLGCAIKLYCRVLCPHTPLSLLVSIRCIEPAYNTVGQKILPRMSLPFSYTSIQVTLVENQNYDLDPSD